MITKFEDRGDCVYLIEDEGEARIIPKSSDEFFTKLEEFNQQTTMNDESQNDTFNPAMTPGSIDDNQTPAEATPDTENAPETPTDAPVDPEVPATPESSETDPVLPESDPNVGQETPSEDSVDADPADEAPTE